MGVFKNNACTNNVIVKPLNFSVDSNFIKLKTNQAETKTYDTKYGFVQATLCDSVPECKDFSDECECPDPPRFCKENCHSFFLMGDRYCDGVEDPAWKYINNPSCPKGFDEKGCPKRFTCSASGKVNIDILEVGDGKTDCDNGLDKKDCRGSFNTQSIFSSETEQIANPAIKVAFWLMGFIVIFGNSYVLGSTAHTLMKKKRTAETLGFQLIIILNISIADFVMGIYLPTIASCSAVYSGIYGLVDHEWKSSLSCSIVGSLAVFLW